MKQSFVPQALNHTESIQEICRPLFENTRITYFSHLVLNSKDEIAGLASEPVFTKLYDERKYYHFDIELLKTIHSPQYILSDLLDFKGKAREIHSVANELGFGHFLTIVKENNGVKECFRFAGDVHNLDMNAYYMHYRDSLENFILYYKEKIQSSSALKGIFNDVRQFNHTSHETYFDTALQAPLNFHPNKYVLDVNQSASLSKREVQCLYWLTQGKTLEEVANILSITRRTVKAHVENIKTKLNCVTLFQLGEAYHRLGLWRLIG